MHLTFLFLFQLTVGCSKIGYSELDFDTFSLRFSSTGTSFIFFSNIIHYIFSAFLCRFFHLLQAQHIDTPMTIIQILGINLI
jgi:hypothetical protein